MSPMMAEGKDRAAMERIEHAVRKKPDAKRRAKPNRMTPWERTRVQVYATGNRWQIENFEAVNGREWM